MFRRTLLSAGTLTLAGVAGCLDQVPSDGIDSLGDDDAAAGRADEDELLLTVSSDRRTELLLTYGDAPDASLGHTSHNGPWIDISLTDEAITTVLDTLESMNAIDEPESVEFNLYHDGAAVDHLPEHVILPGESKNVELDGEFRWYTRFKNSDDLEKIYKGITGEEAYA